MFNDCFYIYSYPRLREIPIFSKCVIALQKSALDKNGITKLLGVGGDHLFSFVRKEVLICLRFKKHLG